MKQNDKEHQAFEQHCKDYNLDRSMHPLHLLYLNPQTQDALKHFKAGFLAASKQER